jgi:hypothetical protein
MTRRPHDFFRTRILLIVRTRAELLCRTAALAAAPYLSTADIGWFTQNMFRHKESPMKSALTPTKWFSSGALVCCLLSASSSAQSPTRIPAHTAEDLPHFSYPVQGTLQDLITMPPAQFTAFAAPVRADIANTLRNYQIDDHAALRKLLQAEVNADIVAGDDTAALALIPQIRALEDKPGPRLMDDIDQEAFLQARMADGITAEAGCPVGYEQRYRQAVQALPWAQVDEDSKQSKDMLAVMSHAFVSGYMESTLAPMITKSRALTLGGAEFLLQGRAYLAVSVPCSQPSTQVLSAYIQAHDIARPDIWIARQAVLPAAATLKQVNVAIWDSGFDTSLFPGRLFTEAPTGNQDAHGIAFDILDQPTHGELIPLNAKQRKDYPALVADMQAFADIEAHVNSPAATALEHTMSQSSPEEVRKLLDNLNIIDSYSHGTHVAGIAADGNPAIRLAYARITYDTGNPHLPPTRALERDTAASYASTVQWFRAHNIRVVNMSWWDRPSEYEKDLADNGIGKDAAERKLLARQYFETVRDGLYAALKSAPDILFVTIAGNSNANNAFEEDIPSSFRLPNLIVTGAVDDAGAETSFTTYGDNVQVDADGADVESVIPGGTRLKMSGTSMAAPQVTNLAAKLLATDPALTPIELIALIRDGADTSKDGRLHLINPKRTVEMLEARHKK